MGNSLASCCTDDTDKRRKRLDTSSNSHITRTITNKSTKSAAYITKPGANVYFEKPASDGKTKFI